MIHPLQYFHAIDLCLAAPLHASVFVTMSKMFGSFLSQELFVNLMHWLHSFDWLQTKLPETRFSVETWFSQTWFLLSQTSLGHSSDNENSHDQFSMVSSLTHIADKYNHLTTVLMQHTLDRHVHPRKMFQIH
jgi:hypothetical protein